MYRFGYFNLHTPNKRTEVHLQIIIKVTFLVTYFSVFFIILYSVPYRTTGNLLCKNITEKLCEIGIWVCEAPKNWSVPERNVLVWVLDIANNTILYNISNLYLKQFNIRKISIFPMIQKDKIKHFDAKELLHFWNQVTWWTFHHSHLKKQTFQPWGCNTKM